MFTSPGVNAIRVAKAEFGIKVFAPRISAVPCMDQKFFGCLGATR